MSKNKKKNDTQSKPLSISKIFFIVVVVLAFVIYLMSNLFVSEKSNNKRKIQNHQVYQFKKDGEVTFQKSTGEFISKIDVEFADNDQKRTQGLMYRTKMDEDQGMLFIFPNQSMQSFWMLNTVLSLDMIFVNSDLKIVTIHKNTEPYTTESYPSTEPAQYVIETLAGYTDKYQIEVGDKVVFRKY